MGTLALIGGTSLLESQRFQSAQRLEITTAYGSVTVLHPPHPPTPSPTRGEGEYDYFLQRHGLGAYTPPHRINHKAHLTALQQLGVTHILAIGSVGSLHRQLGAGRFVIPDDLLAPQVTDSFYDDARGHRLLTFDTTWRQQVIDAWHRCTLPEVIERGVYWHTVGPRFETAAEIRFHQPFADVVGMTIAAECLLASELGMAYAALCVVDNLANGIDDQPLSYESFR
ncbi:MAG: MTAP family purine nucleoside phosphorylase, partial [Magnetococcales bacterium]|nr:MTAP family purine nucleoside phosphorylase [Magnetococcales bacterium]